MIKDVEPFLGIIANFFTIAIACIGLTIWLINRTKKVKIRKFYSLLQNWFDEIDLNLNNNLNLDLLNNKEEKIRQYIEDNKLKNVRLKIKKRDRIKFLKYCGVKKELQEDRKIFSKYSRFDSYFIYIDLIVNSIVGDFIRFYRSYTNAEPYSNWADIEMKLKFLRILVGEKIK